MAFYKNFPSDNEGKINYNGSIINGIVLLAISEIDGVKVDANNSKSENKRYKKSIQVNFKKDGIYIEVSVVVHQSVCVSDMAFKIQENIKHNVEAMTEYQIAKINVNIVGIYFDEEIAG